MTGIFARFPATEFSSILRRWNESHQLLVAAFVLCIAGLFLTNDRFLAQVLFFALVVPAAFLASLRFSHASVSRGFVVTVASLESFRHLRAVPASTISWSVGLYLLMLYISSVAQPQASLQLTNRQFLMSLQIVSFVWVSALFALARADLLRALIAALSAVAGTSAAINMIAYVYRNEIPDRLTDYRLIASIGMPEYYNSTNISATYAVFCIAAVACLVSHSTTRIQRTLLSVGAVLLFSGVLFTQARSAIVAVCAGLAVIGASASRRVRTLVAGAVAVAAIIVIAVPAARDVLLHRGLSDRPEVWQNFIAKAWEQPFLGFGIFANIDVKLRDGRVIDQAHNIILSAQVRGGAIAALAMIAIAAGCLYWGTRFCRATGSSIPLAASVAMLTAGMMDYEILTTYPAWPHVTFWLPIGLCAGAEIGVRWRVDLAAGSPRSPMGARASPDPISSMAALASNSPRPGMPN
ncbi:MAG: O-antigen ligase family protein [Proteobacteria bacterium]|nr:O-antigen ligase family protein [Pseudomonadota bacterium]